MQMMSHPNPKTDCPPTKILADYLGGELREPELGRCEQHLQDCQSCEETIRGLRVDETTYDSFAKLAISALQDQANDDVGSRSAEDEPLVERLVGEIAGLPDRSIGPRLLEDRAAEVTQRLPPAAGPDTLGRLGDYQIKRLLGAGSTGVVYEALDQRLHRRVALKVLRPSLGAAAHDRFMAEARSAAAIDHPGVVTIYQVGEDGTLAYMAMELSDGQTLEQRLHEVSFLPEPEIKRITKQIAQGLAAAHRHGLIHRDIKPANIWLKANTGQALILDFGLARIADDDPQMTATGILAGTPNYMSPEQTRGLELDGRSDLFSLGCLMYRSATGKLPFGSTGVLATLQAIQHDDARAPRQLNPHVGEDFSDLTMMLLQKHPTDRPEHANALVEALQTERHLWPFRADRLAEIDPPTTKPEGVVNRDRRANRGLIGWVAAVVAAGLLGWGCLAFGPQIIRIVTNQGELVIDSKDEAVKIEILQGGYVVRVIDTRTEHSIDIEAGEYRLRLMEDNPNVVLTENKLSLQRGEREIVSIMQNPNRPKIQPPLAKPIIGDSGVARQNSNLRPLPSATPAFVGPSAPRQNANQSSSRAKRPAPRRFSSTDSQLPSSPRRSPVPPSRFSPTASQLPSPPRPSPAPSRFSPTASQLPSPPRPSPAPSRFSPTASQLPSPPRPSPPRSSLTPNKSFSRNSFGDSNQSLTGNRASGFQIPEGINRFGTAAVSSDFVGPLSSSQIRVEDPNLSLARNGINLRELTPEVREHFFDSFKSQITVMNSLLRIGLALHNYLSANQNFPAIGNRDSDGKLLLSWRVHLLPFLELDELYQKFKLDEPWNSPHNLELLPQIPKIYADPDVGEKAFSWKTRIQSPVGKGFFLDPNLRQQGLSENVGLVDITDGTSNTVALIRVASSAAVPWTQPADWDGNVKKLIDDSDLKSNRVWFARADGLVDSLKTPISLDFLKAILTRGGGEIVDWDNQTAQPTEAKAEDTTVVKDSASKEGFGPPAPESRILQQSPSEGSERNKDDRDIPVYAGRTFESWMKSARNDRQLKTKFEALAAATELARGDSQWQQQVMGETTKLLRIYGSRNKDSREIDGVIDRFPGEEIIKLLTNEISNGNDQSRNFVTRHLLYLRGKDRLGRQEYAELLDKHSLSIGQATLKAAAEPECDEASRQTLLRVLPKLTDSLQIKWEANGLEYRGDVDPKWREFIEETFASDSPLKRGFAAEAMTDLDPNRPGLAKDLVKVLADEAVMPLIRCKCLMALERLAPAQIELIAGQLFEVGQQQGKPKELLNQVGKKIGCLLDTDDNSIFYIGVDYRVASLLAESAPSTPGLLDWLNSLKAELPFKSRNGGPSSSRSCENKIVLNAIADVSKIKNRSSKAKKPTTPDAEAGGGYDE